ncbi:MAG: HAMP domain-containing histidine kinase [Ruminococcus sp.]|nr:HAMP domain-containing histidine kinase [Ruminococcus sp.]
MLIAVILLSIFSAALIMYMISYRRQVRKTCRQLAFMKENETNLRLTHAVSSRELVELENKINELVDSMREINRVSRKNENMLKETITNLSHDIRTPLTSLDGYFQLLAESGSEEERRHYIGIIQERISSLKDMLEELFTYTKLSNEAFEISLEPLDFSKTVCDTAFSFYDDFKLRGIEPEVDFCEERLRVSGNEEALRRVLQNIVKNALIHGKSCIRLQMKSGNGYAVFTCSNDVPPESIPEADKVFTRFYKADSARTHASSGLGLSIAKGLTEKMNGSISAEVKDDMFTLRVALPLE